MNALPEDIRDAVEDIEPDDGEELETIFSFLEEIIACEPKKESLESARNQLFSLSFRSSDLRPIHAHHQRACKLIASMMEKEITDQEVSTVATFYTIMRMPKDLAALYFDDLDAHKAVISKESLEQWATQKKTSISQKFVFNKPNKTLNLERSHPVRSPVEKPRDSPKAIGPSHWSSPSFFVDFQLSVTLFLDTCSGFNYLTKSTWRKFNSPELDENDKVEITDVGNNIIPCLGALHSKVMLRATVYNFKFYIWEGDCDILGYPELTRIGFINSEILEDQLNNCSIVKEPKLFMSFDIDDTFEPKIIPCRPIKQHLRQLVRQRLQKECELGYLSPIDAKLVTNASPIVVIPKKDSKEIRICGDYTRVNKSILIPDSSKNTTIKSILELNRESIKVLSSIDLMDAYKQFSIGEKDKHLTTITTPFGFFQPQRAVFGISSVPALFNNTLARLLDGIPHLFRYFDDLAIISPDKASHRQSLSKLFQIFKEYNIICNASKSKLFAKSISFLGFVISEDGSISLSDKMKGTKLSTPTSQSELKGCLAKMSYARYFIPNFAKLAKHLYPKKNEFFSWNDFKATIFKELCSSYSKAIDLTAIDSDADHLRVEVDFDADFAGFAIIWTKMNEQKLFFTNSRILQGAEKRYTPALRFLLGVSMAVEEFPSIMSHNKLLIPVPSREIKNLLESFSSFEGWSSAKTTLNRLMLKLLPFNIQWIYEAKASQKNVPMDQPHVLIASIDNNSDIIVELELVKSHCVNDSLYNILSTKPKSQWPLQLRKFNQLSHGDGVLYLDNRLYIPESLHQLLFSRIHGPHRSLLHMRRTISLQFIVLNYTSLTARFIKECTECQISQRNLKKSVSSLPPSSYSLERIHLDNMQFGSKKICVLYDTYSHLLRAFYISSYASSEIIKCIQQWLDELGQFHILVTDNHKPMISSLLEDWLADHNIYHIRSIPYKSASNGAAERGIQSVRHGLNQLLSLKQTVIKINTSRGPDKKTNEERFRVGLQLAAQTKLEEKYTISVLTLSGSG
uniref:Integrase catalytic domain-containing protein n=1 Tax=Strongyloides stercoralis TaxID=6248 RepID=A0AAF5D1A4_STRER